MFDLCHKRYKAYRYTDKYSYSKFLLRDYKIRSFIEDESRKSRLDIADIIISGTTSIKIDLHTSKPGLVLGKSGANLAVMKAKIASIAELPPEEIMINLTPINKPELNSTIIARRVAQDLERRRSYNHSMRSNAEDALRFGALGIRIQCSGRLNGVEIARDASISRGKLSRMTQRANVFYSAATAHTTSGECGVKVWLNLPLHPIKKRSEGHYHRRPQRKYDRTSDQGAE